MTKQPKYWNKAKRYLSKKDKTLSILIKSYKSYERPILCTEYMARELGSTFQYSLPIFKKYKVGCYNWGLVAGKTQTHFNWDSILSLKKLQKQGNLIQIKARS